ncbi:MAG: metal-dependent transcriptional regulator [Ilumatobacteraceae bacterium]|nr:metal-dependent transcriptional regulator [Ilumatobacteraceae bacterium]
MFNSAEHHPAFEEYCECIFELHEDDLDVIQARIGERLQVSRASVSQMIEKMSKAGLVKTDASHITLTSEGQELAQQVVRRHRLAERFLTDILGLSWANAHQEAGKWEHVMSNEVEVAINRVLGGPTTCPHGNPIPGSSYIDPHAVPLSQLQSGSDFTVSRIPEELEFAPGLLDFLQESFMLPGRRGHITSLQNDGSISVEIEGRVIGVSAFASARILVTS